MADPWLKFYPSDWRADPALRMCSPAARGVWIDMICLMHEAAPYGHLLVNGHCPTDAQLAVLTGTPTDQLSDLIRELEEAGVFSRTKEGVIYSRKMTRMAKKAATARNNGRKGGNPSLGKQKGNQASDNPRDKGRDKPQIPEAIVQSSSVSKDTGAKAPRDPAKVMFDSGVSLLTEAGVAECKARSLLGKWRKAHGEEAVIAAIGRASRESAINPVEFIEGRLRFQKRSSQPQDGDRRERNGQAEVYAVGMGWVPEFS